MFLDNYIDKYNKENSLYKVGLLSMIAIILHNIPEGISIAIPLYYSTKSKKKAILYTFIASLSEPFGALITSLFLINYINNTILGLLFAFIAGIMLQISTSKLLPTGNSYNRKISIIFIIIGFITMLISMNIM